jgi:hypothetical protein
MGSLILFTYQNIALWSYWRDKKNHEKRNEKII